MKKEEEYNIKRKILLGKYYIKCNQVTNNLNDKYIDERIEYLRKLKKEQLDFQLNLLDGLKLHLNQFKNLIY